MTLCIVWRDDSEVVHIASDSRISAADSTDDVAVKVTRLRCEIFPPSSTLDYGSAHYAMDVAMRAGSAPPANPVVQVPQGDDVWRLPWPGKMTAAPGELPCVRATTPRWRT